MSCHWRGTAGIFQGHLPPSILLWQILEQNRCLCLPSIWGKTSYFWVIHPIPWCLSSPTWINHEAYSSYIRKGYSPEQQPKEYVFIIWQFLFGRKPRNSLAGLFPSGSRWGSWWLQQQWQEARGSGSKFTHMGVGRTWFPAHCWWSSSLPCVWTFPKAVDILMMWQSWLSSKNVIQERHQYGNHSFYNLEVTYHHFFDNLGVIQTSSDPV